MPPRPLSARWSRLKGLGRRVSRSSRRMPSPPRTVPTDFCAQLITDTVALYNGHLQPTCGSINGSRARRGPLVRPRPPRAESARVHHQPHGTTRLRRWERRGQKFVVETQLDAAKQRGAGGHRGRRRSRDPDRREREKLFLPYYSTKRRGSGPGPSRFSCARIIAEARRQPSTSATNTPREGHGLQSSYRVNERKKTAEHAEKRKKILTSQRALRSPRFFSGIRVGPV